MKQFTITFLAILAAAAVIWVVFAINQGHEARAKQDAEIKHLTEKAEFGKAESEYWAYKKLNPNYDAFDGQKLTERLREIHEAIENDQPIPPWH